MNVAADAERLACFDAAAARITAVRTSRPEETFGTPSTRPKAADAKLDSIEARIERLRDQADGTLLIELDNGQVWRQAEPGSSLLEAGDPVTISRGALRSFWLSTPNKRTMRVKRVR